MSDLAPLKIAIVAGEESGDLLGADLVAALKAATGREIRLVGLGGRHLQGHGLVPLFDAGEIALVGISAVIADLPRLVRRLGETARAIAAEAPDCLVTIDNPDFTLRVARKVRSANPAIPIIHYVCPSVWAWRPGRARAMKPNVDHILCLLPFEPAELQRLGGPPGTFVGHRIVTHPGILSAAASQALRAGNASSRTKNLLVLPGSRKGEVARLIEPFRETVSILEERGHDLRLVIPTVPHVHDHVAAAVSRWPRKPEIVVDEARKWQAFGEADAALIASGTVSLELAICGVPLVSCYRLDRVMTLLEGLIPVWSALLPNLIADRPVAPEFYNRYVRPEMLARMLEQLFDDTSLRKWQLQGFAEVLRRMSTPRPSGEMAAEVVLRFLRPPAPVGSRSDQRFAIGT